MSSIEGVEIRPLPRFEDKRGVVLRMLRRDDAHFDRFGEIYFSVVNPGAVKAWRRHRRLTSFLAVPVGQLRLVLFDDRTDSASAGRCLELELGAENYQLVTVPPLIWTGWQALGQTAALLANCATDPYDPQEAERRDANDPNIPYSWRS